MIDEKSKSSKKMMAKNGLHKWQYKIKNNFIILLVVYFFRASSTEASNPFLIISSEQQQLLSERNQLSISSALSSLQADQRCFSFIRFIFKASSAGCAGFDLDLILVAQKILCFYLHLAALWLSFLRAIALIQGKLRRLEGINKSFDCIFIYGKRHLDWTPTATLAVGNTLTLWFIAIVLPFALCYHRKHWRQYISRLVFKNLSNNKTDFQKIQLIKSFALILKKHVSPARHNAPNLRCRTVRKALL